MTVEASGLVHIEPGVTVRGMGMGMGIGKWPERRHQPNGPGNGVASAGVRAGPV
ncbi:hypothetical protein ABZY81_39035 [Streptomyces sp. NPDC006514]|uniref:hypothetical protein n=1 Tax=Streptomyces sp. NPDC006514 TaxID=3154308 RepID=UPI0033A0C7DA